MMRFFRCLLLITLLSASSFSVAMPTASDDSKPFVSIDFQDIPIRKVLQIMAEYSEFDIVVSDSVEGNLSLSLDNVEWEQALNVILQIKGLDKRKVGKIIMIAPRSEFEQWHKQALQQDRLIEELGKLASEVIAVHYANAAQLAQMINDTDNGSLLSPRGAISVDERTNSLVIRDLPENLKTIRTLVESIDVPVKQIQIEARLVTISEGDIEELGVRWGIRSSDEDFSMSGSIEGNYPDDDSEASLDDLLNINLGVGNPNASGIAFTVGSLSGTLLDLELSALQTESKAEIISSPRLLTANKKTAYIEQGTEIPYLEAAASGATSVSFKKAVLSLEVTPQITPNNQIILDLNVTQNSPGETVKTGFGEAVSIDTQRVQTQVLVGNNETVVLGGIYQHDFRTSVDKVPVLGDLPLLGSLFKRSYENKRKKELLIFVTPSVVLE